MRTSVVFLAICLCLQLTGQNKPAQSQSKSGFITNPIVNGYFADPTIVKDKGIFYIYATKDPWGGAGLAVFETKDFVSFTGKELTWPTKAACTSPTSNSNKVWAPSVVKAPNGKFYMYVSVGSEVWCGVSQTPLGPWKNAKADNTPLVNGKMFPKYHMIDAECFIDDDGQAYLYWGSGWDWKDGHCFVVKLDKDMVTFSSEPKDITPEKYFEAPFMLKKNGLYYLMYSEGKCTNSTYKVQYSTSKSPFGPWKLGKNSPVLSTSADSTTYGPGHHTIFKEKGKYYILYHRINRQNKKELLRELCIDYLNFDTKGNILRIKPKGVKRL